MDADITTTLNIPCDPWTIIKIRWGWRGRGRAKILSSYKTGYRLFSCVCVIIYYRLSIDTYYHVIVQWFRDPTLLPILLCVVQKVKEGFGLKRATHRIKDLTYRRHPWLLHPIYSCKPSLADGAIQWLVHLKHDLIKIIFFEF